MTTEKLNVLVLATGATINLDGAIALEIVEERPPEFELVLDETTNYGCDPLNSADRLVPDARLFRQTERREKHAVPVASGGLSDATLSWLDDFFRPGVLSHA